MLSLIKKDSDERVDFFVMDAHHHLGEDEDGMEAKPIGVNSSYSFCKKILYGDLDTDGLIDEMKKDPDEYNWKIPDEYFLKTHPLIDMFDQESIKRKGLDTYSIDQIVVFPMHDIFRDRDELLYKASNNFIENWVNTPPHSRRLIGFGRLDPNEDMDKNLKEMERIVFECGLKGLKLHPQSDEFDIGDPRVKTILKKASELNIPVIFHTSYGSEVKKLHDMCNEIIVDLYEEGKEESIPKLKVIIGHCTYRSEQVMISLSHPSIYGELSTLGNPTKFFDHFSKNVDPKRFFQQSHPRLEEMNDDLDVEKIKDIFGMDVSSFEWHNKIMIGTDNPYMPFVKLVELLKAVFSKEMNFDPRVIQNILSGNLLRLLSPRFNDLRKTTYAGDTSSIFQPNIDLIDIHPFVEPTVMNGINLHNTFFRIKNKENGEVSDLFHKKTKMVSVDGNSPDIEEDHFFILKDMKEAHPQIFQKINPRVMPRNLKNRLSLGSV